MTGLLPRLMVGLITRHPSGRGYQAVCLRCDKTFRARFDLQSDALHILNDHDDAEHDPRELAA